MGNTSPLVEQTSPILLSAQQTDESVFANDPLLSAVGMAKDLWADEHADDYVARLRKDW